MKLILGLLLCLICVYAGGPESPDDLPFIQLRQIAMHPRYEACCKIRCYDSKGRPYTWGSGSLIKTPLGNKAILTAGHVVLKPNRKIVMFSDLIERNIEKVIGYNSGKNNDQDFALVFLSSYPDIEPLEIASSTLVDTSIDRETQRTFRGVVVGFQRGLDLYYGRLSHADKGNFSDASRIFMKVHCEKADVPKKSETRSSMFTSRTDPLGVFVGELNQLPALAPEDKDYLIKFVRATQVQHYRSLENNIIPETANLRILSGLSGSSLLLEGSHLVAGIAVSSDGDPNFSDAPYILLIPIIISALYGGITHDPLASGVAIGFGVWFLSVKAFHYIHWVSYFSGSSGHKGRDYFFPVAPNKKSIEGIIDAYAISQTPAFSI